MRVVAVVEMELPHQLKEAITQLLVVEVVEEYFPAQEAQEPLILRVLLAELVVREILSAVQVPHQCLVILCIFVERQVEVERLCVKWRAC